MVTEQFDERFHSETFDTVVVGGGQAGLAMGYHLARLGESFVILDAGARVGDAWRTRWDSLRLFTPARYSGLPGTPYPGSPWAFPGREEFSDYLEAYATEHQLPVRTGTRVTRVGREDDRFVVETPDGRVLARRVVLAAGFDALPRVPAFAAELDPAIAQLHSSAYHRPSDLPDGDALVVGAGNSGADIALELSATRRVLLAGRHPGQIPFRIESPAARLATLVVFAAFSHVLTLRTPIGRRARAGVLGHSGPLVRVKSADLAAAGVHRVPRIAGVVDGRPVTDDGTTLDVAAVVWSTGFRPDFSWLDLPVLGPDGLPVHDRGVVAGQPGLYLLGQLFQYSLASSMIHGVGRDAAYLADRLAHAAATSTATGMTRPARSA
ncbi:NAD(P)/FAD-dependent oxidoreductase [Actinotalea sp. M2MS4P-6]|uniref:flavin-containing monooxygenase n=1 Tax=Actinotalea sp. M2MS4P-6 TaxID=2983762 RepID=UPI0021E465C3|nr:NAD(P)/FAD-dependent oxidoreductase [Actinotalea sp. M2MS4P-6]MCV2395743.1 NAD(P)/FAD-dependent oxidoreductase [Actinotalea sp. M2MS4P-6]